MKGRGKGRRKGETTGEIREEREKQREKERMKEARKELECSVSHYFREEELPELVDDEPEPNLLRNFAPLYHRALSRSQSPAGTPPAS